MRHIDDREMVDDFYLLPYIYFQTSVTSHDVRMTPTLCGRMVPNLVKKTTVHKWQKWMKHLTAEYCGDGSNVQAQV
jgi:hypothetical protein